MTWIHKAFATFAVAVLVGVGGFGALCITCGQALASELSTATSIESAAASITEDIYAPADVTFGEIRNGVDGLRAS